jgi:uncharacterized protein YcaQ
MNRPRVLSRGEARAYLVGQLGLARPRRERGAAGVRAMLDALGCVQMDPLDPMGTNADLVALARVDGIGRGDVFRHTLPGYAFEHWAKERCLLPARAFAYYRAQSANGGDVVETPWWRTAERAGRLPAGVLDAVREEIAVRGPIAASALSDRGRVEPFNWAGWRGTTKAASMAIEVLWTRCEIVVAGRTGREKLWAIPAHALPDHHDAAADGHFDRWALAERVRAAGLLPRGGGAAWSTTLRGARIAGVVDRMVADGALEEVAIEGDPKRRLLAARSTIDRKAPKADDRMRLLGPLDPLLWDRDLVRTVFGFEYLWEVYKPAKQRRWGWYVVPLLHRGRLVGRLEGRAVGTTLAIERVWRERGIAFDEDALDVALERHAIACGCDDVRRASRARRR